MAPKSLNGTRNPSNVSQVAASCWPGEKLATGVQQGSIGLGWSVRPTTHPMARGPSAREKKSGAAAAWRSVSAARWSYSQTTKRWAPRKPIRSQPDSCCPASGRRVRQPVRKIARVDGRLKLAGLRRQRRRRRQQNRDRPPERRRKLLAADGRHAGVDGVHLRVEPFRQDDLIGALRDQPVLRQIARVGAGHQPVEGDEPRRRRSRARATPPAPARASAGTGPDSRSMSNAAATPPAAVRAGTSGEP